MTSLQILVIASYFQKVTRDIVGTTRETDVLRLLNPAVHTLYTFLRQT